jgi:predicted AAA+ superfamily ATPase
MPDKNLDHLLKLYNPWWENPQGHWHKDLPDYRRPIVTEILSDLSELPQMVSVTGPRRVGKTTSLGSRRIRHERMKDVGVCLFSGR